LALYGTDSAAVLVAVQVDVDSRTFTGTERVECFGRDDS